MASIFKRGGLWQRLWFALWRRCWPRRRPPSSSSPARVALLRFDRRVGEVLLQTPLFEQLKKHLPQVERVAVVHPSMAFLLQGQDAVDRVLPCDLRGFPFHPRAWASLFRLAALRADVAVDCSNYTALSTTHAMAALATRAPRLVGFDRGGGGNIIYTHPVAPRDDTRSERLQRLQLLTALDIDVEDQPTCFSPQPEPSPELAALLNDMQRQPGAFAVINPGGRLGWRRVPIELLTVVMRQLIDKDRQPVVVWGPGEREIALDLCMRVGARARLAPPTGIHQLAALFAAAGCTVTSNSGPMHLSIASGAPTLAIFVAMPPDRWGEPRSPHAVVDLRDSTTPDADLRAAVTRFVDELPAP